MAFTFGTGGSGPAFSQFQLAAASAPSFSSQNFGAQPNAQAFGAQGMGGAQGFATPATGQFGAQGAPGFGQAATTLPPGSAFGAPTQQGGFGATGFAVSQAGFAAAAPAVGFGKQGSGFGAAPAPNAFGASSFNGATAVGGLGAKGEGYQITNSICAKMIDQSLESQRFKDCCTGNKGGQPGFGMAGAGGVFASCDSLQEVVLARDVTSNMCAITILCLKHENQS
jgi:hypothetical protein